MKPRRHRFALAVSLWTIAVLVVAIATTVVAVVSLDAANQHCFMDYPSTPCPGSDDPALTWLKVALFGLPALWLVGIVVAVVVRIRRSAPDG